MATKNSYWVESEDWHTAGEPFRIVSQLPQDNLPEGETVCQRRLNVIKNPEHGLDTLRQSLCHEPRGHADMYGGFIMPPDDPGAHFGVLFWHKDGFSTACGHGTIALGYWAVAHNLVQVPEDEGIVDVVIDVPSGRVVASITIEQGKPIHADFINVLSYQVERGLSVNVPSRGMEVNVDLTYGGAVYATLDAEQLGLQIEPGNCNEFIGLGREIKAVLGKRAHHGDYDLYGVIFFREQEDGKDGSGIVKQRNVTVFADGQIDRSPCGSGTCARLAVLLTQGRIGAGGGKLHHTSIIGTCFEADIQHEEKPPVGDFMGCIPRVRGQANLVGQMRFFIDPAETVYPGFLLR